MAGERYAKLTVRTAWSWFDQGRGYQTTEVRFKLAGQWVTYRRGGNPAANEFVVPDPATVGSRDFVRQGVENLLALVRATIAARGLSYAVSVARDAGDDTSHTNQIVFTPHVETQPWPIVEFDVVATAYDQGLDLDFFTAYATGWQVLLNQATIRPVLVTSSVVNALIYGSATGSLSLTPSNGTTGQYTYQWADQGSPSSGYRPALIGPASYQCTVSDASGAATTITVAVGSDPRLEVLVVTTSSSIELQVSGGLPGYTYAWADGPTVALRPGLPTGTYACRVTDSRGAFEDVSVTLSQPPYYWSRNPITLSLDAGAAYRANPATKPNLSFLCEVWVEQTYLSGVFTQVGTTLEQPADRQGRTTFEVQALLDVFLDYHVPVAGSASPQLAGPLFRRFYLKHAQQYGLVPVPAASTSLDHHYVLRGGLSLDEARARTWFTSYQPAHKPLLTWEPASKYVLADQPEYLYYLVQGNPGDFVLRVRLHFRSGPEQVLTYAGAGGVLNHEVYCLPVGYAALGLAAVEAANDFPLVWWEVWVSKTDVLPVVGAGGNMVLSAAAVLSETRRYYLDRRVFPRRRYFLFATSLGGMATYAALGEAQLEVEVTGEELARPLPPDDNGRAGDVAVLARTLRPVLKVAAGPRTQAQLVASQDLLLSARVLLLTTTATGSRWVPGFLKAKTVTLLDEGKLVQTQEFEFTQPAEQLYTPAL